MKTTIKNIFHQLEEEKISTESAVDILTSIKMEDMKHIDKQEDIAIIGVSCRFPGASCMDELWDILKNSGNMIGHFPAARKPDADKIVSTFLSPRDSYQYSLGGYLDDIDKFDCDFFKILPKEADLIDPNQRLFLEIAYDTIRDAGYEGRLSGSCTGVYIGHDNWPVYGQYISRHLPEHVTSSIAGNVTSIVAARISYMLDLKGPAMTIDTACSSSLTALHIACESIRSGSCDMALTGGIKLSFMPVENAMKIGQESAQHMVRTFDEHADGFVWGEGAAAVLLKPLSKAIKDHDNIYAVIKGSSANQDGSSMGIMAPNAQAQTNVILDAWKVAGIDPRTVSYIELHGTGTKIGDPIEKEGITHAFEQFTDQKQFCGVGSLKTNIGHLDNASGIASIVKMVLCLREKALAPTLHFSLPNNELNLHDSPLYMVTKLKNWESNGSKRVCGVNSFGVSGTNVHVVMEEAPERIKIQNAEHCWSIFTISAKTQKALRLLIHRYRSYFTTHSDIDFEDVCYTANTRRTHWDCRVAIVCRTMQELMHHLETLCVYGTDIIDHEHVFESYSLTPTKTEEREGQRDEEFLKDLCRQYVNGETLDFDLTLYKEYQPYTVHMPSYPLERKRHWVEVAPMDTLASKAYENSPDSSSTQKSSDQIVIKSETSERIQMNIESKIRDILANASGISSEQIPSDTSFLEIGFDSISLIRVKQMIMDLFEVDIAMKQFFGETSNLTLLVKYVEAHTPLKEEKDASGVVPSNGSKELMHNKETPLISLEGEPSYYQAVINQQLELMEKQLELLKGINAPQTDLAPNKAQIKGNVALTMPDTLPRPILCPTDIGSVQNAQTGYKLSKLSVQNQIKEIIKKYSLKTKGSKKETAQYRAALANNRNVAGYRQDLKEITYQIISKKAKGSKIWDIDGNEYIDITMGFGVNLFGHYPNFIKDAILEQLETGIPLGPMSDMAGKTAKLLCEITQNERVAFYNTGSEAVMVAIRIARAVTKRSKLVIFAGSYHGAFDGVLARARTDDEMKRAAPIAPGITENLVKDVVVLEYGSQESLEYIQKNAGQLAAVLVEPVQSRNPKLQPRAFLHTLREITQQAGTALIFDEVITGFRIHPAGCQNYFDISADIITYGKIIGGGLPIGAVAGSAKFLDSIDGGVWRYGDDSAPVMDDSRTFVAGTFCNHPLVMAVAYAVLREIKSRGAALQEELQRKTEHMASRLNRFFKEHEIPMEIVHFGSLFRFKSETDITLFYFQLLLRGIYIWEGRNCFLSTAHTDEDIDSIVRAVEDSLSELIQNGSFPGRLFAPGDAVDSMVQKKYPLSDEQKKIWFRAKSGQCSGPLSETAIIRLRGALDIPSFTQAVDTVVERHELLRAKIDSSGEKQLIYAHVPTKIHMVEFSDKQPVLAESMANSWINDEIHRDFDLDKDFLFRCSLIKEREGSYLFLTSLHHIIADGWSINLLMNELCALYNAYSLHIEPKLSAPMQFEEYLQYSNEMLGSEKWEKARLYWLTQYEKPLEVGEIPTDYLPCRIQKASKLHGFLDQTLYENVKKYGAKHQATAYSVLFSAFSVMLCKLTGKKDIVVGIPFARQAAITDASLIGPCVNVLPFRVTIGDLEKFDQLISEIGESLIDGTEHQNFSFDDLNLTQGPLAAQPIIHYLFNMDRPLNQLDFQNLQMEFLPTDYSSTPYQLSVNIVEVNEALQIDFEFNKGLFQEDTIKYFLKLFTKIIEQMVAAPQDTLLSDLTMPSQITRKQSSAYARKELTCRMKLDCLCSNKNDIRTFPKISDDNTRRDCELIAGYLRKNLSPAGTVVCICLANDKDRAKAVLGILKAGMNYLVLPPNKEISLEKYFLRGEIKALIHDDSNSLIKIDSGVSKLQLSDLLNQETACLEGEPVKVQGGEVLCLNSNSTYERFCISGAYLSAHCASLMDLFEIQPDDRVIEYGDSAYRSAAGLLLPAACVGAECLTISNDFSIVEFHRMAMERKATIVCLPVDLLKEWLLLEDGHPADIRQLILTGEILSNADIAAIAKLYGQNLSVWYAYQPDGLPISVSVKAVTISNDTVEAEPCIQKTPGALPLVPGSIALLDDALLPVEPGMPAAVYLAENMLKWNNSTSRKARVEDIKQISTEGTVPLCKTNAIAKHTLSGELEPLGCADSSYCFSGNRLYFAEINAAARAVKNVLSSAIELVDRNGESIPALFIHAAPGSQAEIEKDVKGCLPEYLSTMPLIIMDSWILGRDGKPDKNELLKSYFVHIQKSAGNQDLPQEEKQLVQIWAELLDNSTLNIHDNFFSLGGYSLQAIQLVSKMSEEFSVPLSLQDLMNAPTVSEMAGLIRQKLTGESKSNKEALLCPEIISNPEDRWEPFPLTSVQQAYWVGRSGAFDLGKIATHTYFEVESNTLDIARFEKAWQKLIDRHDMLRAIILTDGTQQVLKSVPKYTIQLHDLRLKHAESLERSLLELRDRMSHQVLASDTWPLFEICAALLPDGKTRLFFSIDALILDTWSFQILMKEMTMLYGKPDLELEPLTITFRDYVMTSVKYQSSGLYEESRNYWLQRLDTLPPAPDLPLAKNPADIKNPKFERHSKRLPNHTWECLKQAAAKHDVTPSGLLLAAYAEVLSNWSANPHFTINLTLFNPIFDHPQINNIVGDFTSLTLLEVDNTENNDFNARVQSIQRQLWNDLNHRFFSGVDVIRALNHKLGQNAQALMPVVFTGSLNTAVIEDDATMKWFGDVVYTIGQTPQVWIDFEVFEKEGCLILNWDSVKGLFQENFVKDMFEAYLRLLIRITEDDGIWAYDRATLTRLLLPPLYLERITAINETSTSYVEKLLQEPFCEQTSIKGQQKAIISTQRELTYDELYRISQNIGLTLREKGAVPNSLVAIVMKKGWEQIAAAMGILLAGAAYLPISSDMPKERLWNILEDANVKIVLAQNDADHSLQFPDTIKVINVDYESYIEEPQEELTFVQSLDDLAYVIYTSGSTGNPKGVMISHRSAWNTVQDINKRFQISENDRVFALSSLSFDLSVYDIFGTLSGGGTIVIPDADENKNPEHWLDMLTKYQVTIWNSVPALLEILVVYAQGNKKTLPNSLRLVLLSGDWIPVTLPQQVWKFNQSVKVISLGGATEASIWSNIYPITSVSPSDGSIPYGVPLSNQTMYVLNDVLELCNPWVPGKIYIGGVGLAIGYWHDEQKTNASFITHPRTGERLYYTGDLGRYRADGIIEFLGRIDTQVKVGGFRVELGEVEAALRSHPNVSNALVTTFGGVKTKKGLSAFVVLKQQLQEPLQLEDPIARLRFKLKQCAILSSNSDNAILLPQQDEETEWDAFYMRRSYRKFNSSPVTLQQLGFLLEALRQTKSEQSPFPKYKYGSAGGLYPIQTYLFIKREKVEGVAEGFYYYHPVQHSLQRINTSSELNMEIDIKLMEDSAFLLFLVTDYRAIKPLYGDDSARFSILEAGLISQLLETEAPKLQLGVCQFGNLDIPAIRQALQLNEHQMPVHCIIGGGLDITELGYDGYIKEMQQYKSLFEIMETEPVNSSNEIEVPDVSIQEELKQFLHDKLPEYMVPASIVVLSELPISPNGKIDRKKLEKESMVNLEKSSQTQEMPHSDLEKTIANIMCEILALDQISIFDNFFDLGANSVDLIRIHNQVQNELNVKIPVVEIFRRSNIASLASYLHNQETSKPNGSLSDDARSSKVKAGKDRLKRLKK